MNPFFSFFFCQTVLYHRFYCCCRCVWVEERSTGIKGRLIASSQQWIKYGRDDVATCARHSSSTAGERRRTRLSTQFCHRSPDDDDDAVTVTASSLFLFDNARRRLLSCAFAPLRRMKSKATRRRKKKGKKKKLLS